MLGVFFSLLMDQDITSDRWVNCRDRQLFLGRATFLKVLKNVFNEPHQSMNTLNKLFFLFFMNTLLN